MCRAGRAGSPLPAVQMGHRMKPNAKLSMRLPVTRRRRDSPPYQKHPKDRALRCTRAGCALGHQPFPHGERSGRASARPCGRKTPGEGRASSRPHGRGVPGMSLKRPADSAHWICHAKTLRFLVASPLVGPDLRAGRVAGWPMTGRPEVGPYWPAEPRKRQGFHLTIPLEKCCQFLQIIEKTRANFPIIGKKFSNHWKKRSGFSNHWKKSFQPLENFRAGRGCG